MTSLVVLNEPYTILHRSMLISFSYISSNLVIAPLQLYSSRKGCYRLDTGVLSVVIWVIVHRNEFHAFSGFYWVNEILRLIL